MLKRITCEQFRKQPKPFRAGLNVVLGSSDGSNAIGKSTFLLIIDFVFGGDEYAKITTESSAHVPHHSVNMEFEFDSISYFFSRNTAHPNMISRCNSQYSVIDDIPVQKYRDWLYHEYKIINRNINFGEMISRFFRIYGLGNQNERRPLTNNHEQAVTAVEYLMKLLDKYDDIHSLKTAEAEFDIKGSNQSTKTAIDLLAEISTNKETIEAQENRRRKLCKQNEEADLRALGIDSRKIEQFEEVSNRLRKLNSRKRALLSQLNAVRNNLIDSNTSIRKDFTALRRFFPDADLDAFQEVEQFHIKIARFLQADIDDEIARLEPLIEYVNADIAELEKAITNSGITQNLSQSILTQYASVTWELEKLHNENKELQRQVDLLDKRNDIEKTLANLRRKQEESLSEVESVVNAKMKQINEIVTDGNRPAPILTLKPDKTFTFETPDDRSEGTAYKGLVIYDLAILALTSLPVLVHDSNIVKRIEDTDFERILGFYRESGIEGKQVFIAFDKADSSTQTAHDILEADTVLHLSIGNELYGKSWSRKYEKEKSRDSEQEESE